MDQSLSFIETQFPVSKMSKESYKERKSSQGQTITGLGKWWGRKPLVLVRAAIIGCLMPASDNPKKDTEIFLKLMSMDTEGLLARKEKSFSIGELYDAVCSNKKLSKFKMYFDDFGDKVKLKREAPRDEIEVAVFETLSYDEKITMCNRPEHIELKNEQMWNEINHHLGTSAKSLSELIKQLSERSFQRNVVIGDCFCGGGSIPFEAARIGCDAYASDLNPVAGLLTWADVHVCGASKEERDIIEKFQKEVYRKVDKEITDLGVEMNECGDRALSYLYCVESVCPECGWKVPLLPSLIVGIRAGKVVVDLVEELQSKHYNFKIRSGVTSKDISAAQANGTVRNNAMICPHCGKSTPISALRHDTTDENGNTVYGLRLWNVEEFEPRTDDIFTERLYAVRYEHIDVLPNGKTKSTRYYTEPGEREIKNEKKILEIVRDKFASWQENGFVPSTAIEDGYNTSQIIRERGWKYWHQLFNPRQLLLLSLFAKYTAEANTPLEKATGILGLNKCADFNSKLCRWNPNCDKTEQTFYNQALNTLMNWGTRSLTMISTLWFRTSDSEPAKGTATVMLCDARDVKSKSDIWITDPPYADAVNYHELSEFFLAWDKKLLMQSFTDWYADSKRILAVRGDEHFSQTMIDIYSNLTCHMSDNGLQVVMFTHSDPAVWAQLAIIMWKAGLKVTAAWNIATETDASGLKNGNYVKGIVMLVLRKQRGGDFAFLDEINADIRTEVKNQIVNMQALDDKEEPNFADPDYVLAAYAASLKVLTSYATIEDLDLDYELNQAISNPSGSKIVSIIENAKKIAFDCVIPVEFSSFLWRDMTSAEKFYIKGLESEKRGNYQISTYQEFARGFSIGGYSQLMANERANTARLKTPFEMAGRTMSDVPDFESSIMRTVFHGIYVGIKEEMNPQKALGFIKNELNNYWDKREMIGKILSFLVDIKDISNMQPHWTESAEMAELLLAAVTHDGV